MRCMYDEYYKCAQMLKNIQNMYNKAYKMYAKELCIWIFTPHKCTSGVIKDMVMVNSVRKKKNSFQLVIFLTVHMFHFRLFGVV